MVPDGFHQKPVIDVIEQSPDVELKNPIVPPATFAADIDRLMSRLSRSISIGIFMKMRFQY